MLSSKETKMFGTNLFNVLTQVTTYVPVPAASVWSTCVLHNGDLVAACSDSKVYVFSTDRARVAPDDIQVIEALLSPWTM